MESVTKLICLCLLVVCSLVGVAQEDEERAEKFYKGKDYHLAIKKYTEIFRETGQYSHGKRLALTFKYHKDFVRAEEVYMRLRNLPDFAAEDHLELANLLLHNEKPALAVGHLREYLRIHGQSEEVRNLLLFAELLSKKEIEQACPSPNQSNLCVEIDSRSAIDPQNPNMVFEWIIDEQPPQTGFVIKHCFEEPGTYYARLNVIDITTGLKYNNDTIISVDISNEAMFTTEGHRFTNFELGYSVNYKIVFGDIDYTYIWDLGDGTFKSGAYSKHKYQNSGNYPVKLYLLSQNQKGVASTSCVFEEVTVTTNIHDIY